jgi:hypothetical protein
MTFQPTDTPDWVSPAFADATTASPEVGELWTLAWDGRYEGAAVIADVFADHVLALPVTDDRASGREIELPIAGTNLALWPQAETGLGMFLLHARVASPLSVEQTLEIRRWEAQRGDLSSVSAGTASSDRDRLDALLTQFQRLCFIEWPSEAEAVLDVDAMAMSAREFAGLTGLATPRVLALWSGMPVTEDERELMGERARDWLTVRADAATLALSVPAVKDLFMEFMALSGGDERSARNAARNEYALAARTDSAVVRNTTRAVDTVKAMIAAARASIG